MARNAHTTFWRLLLVQLLSILAGLEFILWSAVWLGSVWIITPLLRAALKWIPDLLSTVVGLVVSSLAAIPFMGLLDVILSKLLIIRDDLNLSIAWEQAASDPRGYFLILRSFSETINQRLDGATVDHGPGSIGTYRSLPISYHDEVEHDICWDLEEAASPFGRLVFVGGRWKWHTRRAYALHVRLNHGNWESVVTGAAQFARIIFLIPESTRGVLAEIKMLLQNDWLDKTLVLIPADPENLRGGTRAIPSNNKNALETWNRLRTELRAEGFQLPEFEPDGAMFRPNAELSSEKMIRYAECRRFPDASWQASLHPPQRECMQIALRAFLADIPSKYPLTSAVARLRKLRELGPSATTPASA